MQLSEHVNPKAVYSVHLNQKADAGPSLIEDWGLHAEDLMHDDSVFEEISVFFVSAS